nr:putative reverse transcriptase domain-containing protein [Tanacetum cinerariifolium]
GSQLFVAHVTEKEPQEKQIEDVPVIRDFPEVFPNDLPGLPPPRQVVNVPYNNKTLVVEGDRGASRLKVISCIKARKFIERGSQLFVAHVTEKEPQEKQIEDVPVIRDFPEVFPNDLPGLPPPRQVEF